MQKGQKNSPETLEKMRAAAKERWQKPGYREQISAAQIALNQDPERCKKRIDAVKASFQDPEIMARRIAANKDHERCRKISEAQKGRVLPREWADNIGKGQKGRKRSPETCERLRQAALNRSAETIDKIRQARLRQKLPNKMTDIECALRDEFNALGLTFEMHKSLFGRFQPDFVFTQYKLAVQADGDYWHKKTHLKGSGKMIEKDAKFNARAATEGWTVFRFSEADILANAAACASTVAYFIQSHA